MKYPSLMTALILLGLLPAPAAPADDELSPHHLELLLARVEDLHRRLATPDTPESLAREGLTIQRLPDNEHKDLAGARIERLGIRVTGQADRVLRWLDLASTHQLVPRPPLSVRSLAGPDRPVQVELSLWRVTPAAFEPGAGVDALKRLRDTLMWLEDGQDATSAVLALLDGLTDFETVRLEQATWHHGKLTGRASALDGPAKDAYRKLLAQRLAGLARPPESSFEIETPAVPAKADPATVQMAGCPVADALLLAAGLAGTELVVLADPAQIVSYRGSPADATTLLTALIARATGLKDKKFGAVHVLAADLAPAPPALDVLPETPVVLRLHRVRPGQAWKQIAAATRTGLLAPGDQGRAELTAALRKRTARQVAGLLAWVQGLLAHPSRGLVLMLPAGAAQPAPLERPTVAGPVDLIARRAPLAALVAGLTGLESTRDCGPGQPDIDLWLRDAQPARLAADLLAVHRRTLRTDGPNGQLVVTQAQAEQAACPAPGPAPKPPEGPARLAAVMRTGKGPRALLVWGTVWRWMDEDEALPKGWRLAAIKARRAVLLGPDGRSEHLYLQAEAGPRSRSEPSAEPGPTRQGLSDLRLAVTAIVGQTRPTALVADREGHLHRVSAGEPIGRRCGRVLAVLPGALDVHLDCARDFEPKQVRMQLKEK